GIWLWWPATIKQIRIRSTIKKGAPAQRVIADLHNVLGIYPFVALLVVTLTGSMIVFYKPIQDVVVDRFGSAKIPRAPVVEPKPGATMLPIDELMAIAERNSPESRYVFVMYPSAPTQPFYAYRRSEIGILPDTRIYLDPYDGKVLQIGKESTDPTSKKIMRSASGIHFGRWGSLGIKIVYFVLGFIPLGLFVTGILMFIRRRRSKVASQKRKKARIAEAS
ncbi:PepSY domain-containing protein, partial [bacterium]